MWSRDHVAGWAKVDFKITKTFQLKIPHVEFIQSGLGRNGRAREKTNGGALGIPKYRNSTKGFQLVLVDK